MEERVGRQDTEPTSTKDNLCDKWKRLVESKERLAFFKKKWWFGACQLEKSSTWGMT